VAKQHKSKSANKLRIIGGRFRSRQVEFVDVEGLRPTPDRVRETLFNWLQPHLAQARCLDLFAGSGALAFEATSRGAESVLLVETNAKAAKQLTKNLDLLKAENTRVLNQTAQSLLSKPAVLAYDVVFIDPPYKANLWVEIAQLLTENNWLAENAMIYLESPSKQTLPVLPESWQLKKDKTAGEVRYCLFQFVA
jgi:16S rRNA (guanine966-N2)-methyltransferase